MNEKLEEYYQKIVNCSAALIQAAGRASFAVECLEGEKERNRGLFIRNEKIRAENRLLKKEINKLILLNKKKDQLLKAVKRKKCMKMVKKMVKKSVKKPILNHSEIYPSIS